MARRLWNTRRFKDIETAMKWEEENNSNIDFLMDCMYKDGSVRVDYCYEKVRVKND